MARMPASSCAVRVSALSPWSSWVCVISPPCNDKVSCVPGTDSAARPVSSGSPLIHSWFDASVRLSQ